MNDTDAVAFVPRQQGKITGPELPLPVTFGSYAPSCISRSARATWRCSILPLTANCLVATSSPCASMMWRPTAMPSTELMSGRGSPAGPFALS